MSINELCSLVSLGTGDVVEMSVSFEDRLFGAIFGQAVGDGEVRFVFTNPHPFGNADASLSLQVVVRGDEHFLECRAEGRFRFALPRFCRSSAEPLRVQWPPESAKAAK